MADDTHEDASDETISSSTPGRFIVSLKMVFLSVGIAAVILGGIFVLDPAFLSDKKPQASDDVADDSEDGQEGRGGEGRGGRGGRGGGGFDPAAIFAQRDTDGNDILEGEEISERMVGRLARIDSDGDGKVTKEEFMSGVGNRGGGGGGRGAGGQGGRVEGGERPGGDRAGRRPGAGAQGSADEVGADSNGEDVVEASESASGSNATTEVDVPADLSGPDKSK